MKKLIPAFLPILAMLLASCATTPLPKTVDHLELQKFMGDWYVISYLPWFAEKGNVNTMDIYELAPDGRINVTYAFRKKSLDAPRKEWKAKAKVFNKESNAHWKVQFIPLFSADFLVLDLADDYRYTVVGGASKNLVWIMSRKPTLSDADYQGIVSRLAKRGYNTSKLERVIQPKG